MPELRPRPGAASPDLIGWLEADPGEFRRSLRGTSLARAKRGGLLRNAALILGSRGVRAAVPALIARLSDADPVVRSAAAWALGRLGAEAARDRLRILENDEDPAVREAARQALGRLDQADPAVTSTASPGASRPDPGSSGTSPGSGP